ncbi:PREDICTED: protein prune homolog [Cyprinodon variegatus]|uniref:protein prune homolog n=1 Tax=Cyprinodon variegatus TaxID=28743 RepID=UPI0007428CD0|nr:PREDICTED: protein prune homolog [Cyprinodon variegatus]
MEEFLRACRRTLQEDVGPAGPGVHVVLGNEACDVDSMVSALAFAYFLFRTAGGDPPVLPLLNIRQSELVLRSDNLFLLRRTGLSPDLLLFRDQLDLRALHTAGRLRLTLVDHNVLPSSDADLEGAVVEVLDHHQLERKASPSCPVTVEMVGSCATLVTERIIQKAPQILDQQLAQLLYAAMVLDCVNMAPAAGKVTPKDSQYAAALETRFPALPPRGALFQELQEAKFDVSGEFMSFCASVSKFLEQARTPDLDLHPVSSSHPHISAYHQGNKLASRKKLLPIVKNFLRECDGDCCLGDAEEESVVPPTPMNSLVEGCPLDEGLPKITAEDLQDKFRQMDSADL